MVDSELLRRLEEKGVINKRGVMWWQFGFEGRRVISEEEFRNNLQEVRYRCLVNLSELLSERSETPKYEEKTFKVWSRDDVPLVLRRVKLADEEVEVFVTINPMSHWSSGSTGWKDLEINKSDQFPLPLSTYRTPHIRGVVIEQTPEFLFWNPITMGMSESTYFTRTFNIDDTPVIVSPVNTSKFYHNLIRRVWGGKRAQKAALELDLKREGLEVVTYYDFDSSKNHVTVYPGAAFEGRLDLPVIIRGNPDGMPRIVGAGVIHCFDYNPKEPVSYGVSYWKLEEHQARPVRASFVRRLGRVRKNSN